MNTSPIPPSLRPRARQQSGQVFILGLLAAILIIAILAKVEYPNIAGRNEYAADGSVKGAPTPIDRANDVACGSYQGQVRAAEGEYRQDHGTPAPDLESLKQYGVTEDMIDTPDCTFNLPKVASAAPAGAPGQPAGQQGGYGGGYGRRGGYGGGYNQQAPTSTVQGGGISVRVPNGNGGGGGSDASDTDAGAASQLN